MKYQFELVEFEFQHEDKDKDKDENKDKLPVHYTRRHKIRVTIKVSSDSYDLSSMQIVIPNKEGTDWHNLVIEEKEGEFWSRLTVILSVTIGGSDISRTDFTLGLNSEFNPDIQSDLEVLFELKEVLDWGKRIRPINLKNGGQRFYRFVSPFRRPVYYANGDRPDIYHPKRIYAAESDSQKKIAEKLNDLKAYLEAPIKANEDLVDSAYDQPHVSQVMSPEVFWIVGRIGQGKSTVIERFVRSIEQSSNEILIIRIDELLSNQDLNKYIGDTRGEELCVQITKHVCDGLAKRIREIDSTCKKDGFAQASCDTQDTLGNPMLLLEKYACLAKNGVNRILIIVDELDLFWGSQHETDSDNRNARKKWSKTLRTILNPGYEVRKLQAADSDAVKSKMAEFQSSGAFEDFRVAGVFADSIPPQHRLRFHQEDTWVDGERSTPYVELGAALGKKDFTPPGVLLGDISLDEVREMIGNTALPTDLAESLSERIYALTRGQPFLIAVTLQGVFDELLKEKEKTEPRQFFLDDLLSSDLYTQQVDSYLLGMANKGKTPFPRLTPTEKQILETLCRPGNLKSYAHSIDDTIQFLNSIEPLYFKGLIVPSTTLVAKRPELARSLEPKADSWTADISNVIQTIENERSSLVPHEVSSDVWEIANPVIVHLIDSRRDRKAPDST